MTPTALSAEVTSVSLQLVGGVPIRILPNARRKHRKRSADLLSSQTVVYPPPEYLG